MTKISLCYYPTSTIFVDDNKDFFISISTNLITESGLLCYFYDEPHLALRFLNEQYQADPFINRCIVSDDENDDPANHVVVNLDVTAIHKEIYNPKRFSQTATLVIDYGMPGTNGADFCQQVKDEYIKKIMLTGEADKDLAVQLFNERKIDKFITKDATNLTTMLTQALAQMQQDYFLNLSAIALNQSNKQSRKLLKYLSDPAFITLFDKVRHQVQAIEYYLLDNQGSFLFLDKDAKPSCLIVVSDEEMDAYYNIAKYGDATEQVIKSLENRTKLPYFPASLERKIPPFTWEKYLYPAEVVEGKERYYYSFITNPKIPDIRLDKISSYQNYLDTIYQDYLNNLLTI